MPSFQNAHRRHAAYYEDILKLSNELFHQGGEAVRKSLNLFDSSWENIKIARAWAAANKDRDQQAAVLTSNCADYAALLLPLRLRVDDRLEWREDALAAARLIGNRKSEAAHLINLGNIRDSLGKHRRAVELYGEALIIKRELSDKQGESVALDNMGIAYLNLNEPERAIECLEQAMAVFPNNVTIDDSIWEHNKGHVLGSLGRVYLRLENYPRATEYLEQALRFARGSGARSEEATLLFSLGQAYAVLGNHRQAISSYNEALVFIGNWTCLIVRRWRCDSWLSPTLPLAKAVVRPKPFPPQWNLEKRVEEAAS